MAMCGYQKQYKSIHPTKAKGGGRDRAEAERRDARESGRGVCVCVTDVSSELGRMVSTKAAASGKGKKKAVRSDVLI